MFQSLSHSYNIQIRWKNGKHLFESTTALNNKEKMNRSTYMCIWIYLYLYLPFDVNKYCTSMCANGFGSKRSVRKTTNSGGESFHLSLTDRMGSSLGVNQQGGIQNTSIHDMHQDYVNNLPTMSFPLPFRILFPHRQSLRKTSWNDIDTKEREEMLSEKKMWMKTKRHRMNPMISKGDR